MLRKMIKTANGPQGAFVVGQSYDFERMGLEEFGQRLEDAGAAVRVAEAAVEPRAERAVEAPVEIPPPVKAEPKPAKPKPRAKKRPTRKRASKKISG